MKKLVTAAAAVLAAGAALSAGPAIAATSCTYSSGTHTVSIQMPANGDSAFITRNGTAIWVNGAPCGAADISNTKTVSVTGASGAQSVTISMTAGAFAPGFSIDHIQFSVKLGNGDDTLYVHGTTAADDFLLGANGGDLDGDGDLDLTFGSIDHFNLYGDADNDVLSAAGGGATGSVYPARIDISGDLGNDTITGGQANDYLTGFDGSDTIAGGEGADNLDGGTGVDTLDGGADADIVSGGGGNDQLSGGAGNDIFPVGDGDGDDLMIGGGGTHDRADYSSRGTGGVNLSLDGVANDGRPGVEFDNIQPDVEDLIGSKGPDTLVGSGANNKLDGRLGADTMTAGAGDDDLYDGPGDAAADVLNGGGDDDHLNASAGNDQLNGNAGADIFADGPGNDVDNGGSGNDYLSTEAAANGADVFNGGTGYDTVSYAMRSANVTLKLDGNNNDGASGESDRIATDVENIYTGSGNDTIVGSAAANPIDAGSGADVIDGAAGNDNISGGDGNDTIDGGDGADAMYGQNDDDTFEALDGGLDQVDGGPGTDTVASSDPFDLISNVP